MASGLALGGLLLFALSGCDERREPVTEQVITDAPLDPASYAGELVFGIAETLPTETADIPFVLKIGLTPENRTQIAVKTALDLRELQRQLPQLVSGRHDPSCGLGLDVTLATVEAVNDAVRTRGSVQAELYRCRGGTADRDRGFRIWSEDIAFEASFGAALDGDCLDFHLRDLALDPQGVLGRLGTVFGITERVRKAGFAQVNKALQAAPICPEIPPGLAVLSPKFENGAPMEIGAGGLGATLSGRITTDAARLIDLLRLGQARGLLAGDPNAPQGSAAIRIEDTLPGVDPPVGYRVDLGLRAESATRIGVDALLDLRELQQALPERAEGALLVDDCASRVELTALETTAAGANLVALARLDARSFACERSGDTSWQRGALERNETVDVRAEVSASIEEDCAVFHLVDIARDPPMRVLSGGRQGERTQAARSLFIDAVDLLLKDHPLCPDPPEWLDLLDPDFANGAPREIGEGGLGLGLDGSIDLDTTAIIALLKLLQARGALPAP
ncbi:hypothetical protein R5H30_09660 [Sulfitobacter sp. D35]|uniref:hypothetical protein n=1 Tax=Sulfitobacter sp. D35 TaxID=3083252 RepID=UPI00296F4B19|nr:hypothetical protein [Sulfitobacter sp. D35]MDW4498244.1 hypothetical protein [Sulfitobacter sp. D35]